jgi:hypothetical protein
MFYMVRDPTQDPLDDSNRLKYGDSSSASAFFFVEAATGLDGTQGSASAAVTLNIHWNEATKNQLGGLANYGIDIQQDPTGFYEIHGYFLTCGAQNTACTPNNSAKEDFKFLFEGTPPGPDCTTGSFSYSGSPIEEYVQADSLQVLFTSPSDFSLSACVPAPVSKTYFFWSV